MNAADLIEQFAEPLMTGGTPRLDLPMTADAFAALVADHPPEAPALAAAMTRACRAIWANSPPATVDTDTLYTVGMLHDLLGALHPIFIDSVIASVIGRRVEARLEARRRRLKDPLTALRRHVLADAALRSHRQDEHVDLAVVGRISAYGELVRYRQLPWRVESARTTTEVSAQDAFSDVRWAVLERLSPLTAFAIGVQEGTALPWIRWLTASKPILRFVVQTLIDARTGPFALMATIRRLSTRRPEDARWWLGLALLVGERSAHGPDDFRMLVESLRPYGARLGAPHDRPRRAPTSRTARMAIAAAGLEI